MNLEKRGLGLTILRLALGVIFLTHGVPKLLGGAAGTAEMFAGLGIPLPGLTAWIVTLLESVGGLALLVGVATTPLALLLSVHMLLGIFLVHLSNGWYVLGPGQGGMEFNVLLIAGLLTLVFEGPGRGLMGGTDEPGSAAA